MRIRCSGRTQRERVSPRSGLTLVELLTVIAVISILISILIPTVSTVRTSARRAKAKIILTQWASAIETFRQEYGYYPTFSFNSDGLIDTAEKSDEFFETLSSRKPDGTRSDPPPGGNSKKIAFYTFSESEVDESDRVADEFGSILFGVLIDKDYDGIITVAETGADYPAFPDIGFGTADPPPGWPSDGLRAGVAIYSPGPGGSLGKVITTW
jgi:prepilin-type N-terminal cleavage/methylation domain-containing protein